MRPSSLLSVALFTISAFCSPLTRRAPAAGKVAAGWYAGWHSTSGFPLSEVPWSKYTHLTYAFAIPTDAQTLSISSADEQLIPQFVSQAHQNGVEAIVSLGGYTGSTHFSTIMSTPESRTTFVKTIIDFVKKYDLDGIDFDWEYPNAVGAGNVFSANDTPNFLAFLKELRADPLGKTLTITAATFVTPYNGASGSPSTDLSGFPDVLDWVAIMNYDIYGSWSDVVGPNAPLADACAPAINQHGSATSAINSWHAAGFPMNQIVLAVAGYGHTFRVANANAFEAGASELARYPTFVKGESARGDAWFPDGGSIDFWGMVKNGYLNEDGTPNSAMSYRFDSCSQTPYLYDPTSAVMVSYDDATSFAAKGNFIQTNGLRGYALWEAGGDYKNILVNSIRGAMGV